MKKLIICLFLILFPNVCFSQIYNPTTLVQLGTSASANNPQITGNAAAGLNTDGTNIFLAIAGIQQLEVSPSTQNTANTAVATQAAGYYLPFSTNAAFTNGQIVTGTNIPTGTQIASKDAGTASTTQTAPIASAVSANPIPVTNDTGILVGQLILDSTTAAGITSNTIVTAVAGSKTSAQTLTANGSSASGQKVITVSANGTNCTAGMLIYDTTTSGVSPQNNVVGSSNATSVTGTLNLTGGGVANGDTIVCYDALTLSNAIPATGIALSDSLIAYPTVTLSQPTTGVIANGATITFQNNATSLASNNVTVTGSEGIYGNLNVGGGLNILGTPLSGTGTTAVPLLYFNNSANAVTNWATQTYMGFNTALNFSGNVIDLHNNGNSTSFFSVNSGGTMSLNGNINLASGTTLHWSGASNITSSTSGIIELINNALTSFTRLQFGGTTSSFPALQLNGTGLNAELADGSNLTFFEDTGTISAGTKFTTSGCSVSATTGGATAGTYTSGTTGTCTVIITMNGATGLTAPNGWTCFANDETTPADKQQTTAHATTTATISGTTASGDVVSFGCTGY